MSNPLDRVVAQSGGTTNLQCVRLTAELRTNARRDACLRAQQDGALTDQNQTA